MCLPRFHGPSDLLDILDDLSFIPLHWLSPALEGPGVLLDLNGQL